MLVAKKVGRNQLVDGLLCHAKEFGLLSVKNRRLPKGFKTEMTKSADAQGHFDNSAEGGLESVYM